MTTELSNRWPTPCEKRKAEEKEEEVEEEDGRGRDEEDEEEERDEEDEEERRSRREDKWKNNIKNKVKDEWSQKKMIVWMTRKQTMQAEKS